MPSLSLHKRIEKAINRILYNTILDEKTLRVLYNKLDYIENAFAGFFNIPIFHPDPMKLKEIIKTLNDSEDIIIYFVKNDNKVVDHPINSSDVINRKIKVVFSSDKLTIYTSYYELNDYFRIEEIKEGNKMHDYGLIINANFAESFDEDISEEIKKLVEKFNLFIKGTKIHIKKLKFLKKYLIYLDYLRKFVKNEKKNPRRIFKYQIKRKIGDRSYQVKLEQEGSIFSDIREGMWLEYRGRNFKVKFKIVEVIDPDEGLCVIEHIRGDINSFRDSGVLYVLPNEFVLKQLESAVYALLLGLFDEHKLLFKVLSSPSRYISKKLELPKVNFEFEGFREENEENRNSIYAIKRALSDAPITIIYGPPGSGKTQLISELIVQLSYYQNKKVLFIAPTHIAVDNVLERIERDYDKKIITNISPIRIGVEERVSPTGARYLLPQVLKTVQDNLRKVFSNIMNKTKGLNINLVNVLKEYEELINNKSEFDKIGENIVKATKLLCTTLIGAVSLKELRDIEPIFDVVILDEASKASMIEFLVPAIKAKKWIIIGDPYQLPPYLDEYEVKEIIRIALNECKVSYHEESIDDIIQYWRNKYEARISEDRELEDETEKRLNEVLDKDFAKCSKKIKRVLKAIGDSVMISPITYFKERIKNKESIVKLVYQFRMHPDIAELSNKFIYNGNYKTPKQLEKERELPLKINNEKTKPIIFYSIESSKGYFESREGTSYKNEKEARIIVNILKEILPQLREIKSNKDNLEGSIGIITFYASQAKLIRKLIRENKDKLGLEIESAWRFRSKIGDIKIKVSIVDRFQGQENDIIILSFVRSNRHGKLGFLRNKNRINVAITRARYILIMVGDMRTLRYKRDRQSKFVIRKMIDYIQNGGCGGCLVIRKPFENTRKGKRKKK